MHTHWSPRSVAEVTGVQSGMAERNALFSERSSSTKRGLRASEPSISG